MAINPLVVNIGGDPILEKSKTDFFPCSITAKTSENNLTSKPELNILSDRGQSGGTRSAFWLSDMNELSCFSLCLPLSVVLRSR